MPDYSDLPSRDDDPTCPNCGSTNITREIVTRSSANSSSNRDVGGQHRQVRSQCDDCGWSRLSRA